MTYKKAFEIVRNLKRGERYIFFQKGDTKIILLRPDSVFKNYDITKNFQIFLKEGKREFRPNHLRVMIDLHLKVRSRPDLKEALLLAFDKIFYKIDPNVAIKNISGKRFKHYLNSVSIIANLSQLFLIEQEYNYIGESNYNPPTLFYQGWIRQFIDSSREIDNLCMSVCSRQPPAAKYTSSENKKHKKWQKNISYLWYLDRD